MPTSSLGHTLLRNLWGYSQFPRAHLVSRCTPKEFTEDGCPGCASKSGYTKCCDYHELNGLVSIRREEITTATITAQKSKARHVSVASAADEHVHEFSYEKTNFELGGQKRSLNSNTACSLQCEFEKFQTDLMSDISYSEGSDSEEWS